MIGDFNDKTNFSHKLLLADTQVSRFYRAFGNNSSAKIKLWKNSAIWNGTVKRIFIFASSTFSKFRRINEFNTEINKGIIYRKITIKKAFQIFL